MKTAFRALLLLTVTLSVNCDKAGDLVDSIKDLQQVQLKIATATKEPNVFVHLANDRYLTIRFTNSSLRDLPAAAKKLRAREIAGIAYEAFPSRQKLQKVSVVYFVQKTYVFFFHYTDGRDAYSFDAGELAASGAAVPQVE